MTQLSADTGATATRMAEEILGPRFTINSARYAGDPASSGIYKDGNTSNPGVLPSDRGVILSTGRVASFGNATGANNQDGGTSTHTKGVRGDADFDALAGRMTHDAAFLEVNFTPHAGQSSLNIEFRFYSEEYNEYVYSNFNDVALVMLDGVQVPLSVGAGNISVNAINNAAAVNPTFGSQKNDPDPGNGRFDSASPNLYIDNAEGTFDTEFDGFTVTLSLDIPVTSMQSHDLKIGIADTGDPLWDSALVIASNDPGAGVEGAPVAADDMVRVSRSGQAVADLMRNDTDPHARSLRITEINGAAVVAGQSVTLPSGQVVTLNANGTITIAGNGADEGSAHFSYTVSDPDGNTDSAFVTLNTTLPCFVAGSAITTVRGDVPIEALRVGDLVVTRDAGLQPIRWIGQRWVSRRVHVASGGALCPVRIPAGAFGRTVPIRDLDLSPQHRVLLGGMGVTLLTGMEEALAPARFLIGINGIHTCRDAEDVLYFHLLFDAHQVIYSNGLPSESLHPGHMVIDGFEPESREALFARFPYLRSDPNRYGATARAVLRPFEVGIAVAPHAALVA